MKTKQTITVLNENGTIAAEAPPLPAAWISPVDNHINAIIRILRAKTISDTEAHQRTRRAIEQIPALIDQIDISALTDTFEAAMGQAATITLRKQLRRRAYPSTVAAGGDRRNLTASNAKSIIPLSSATGPTVSGVAFAPIQKAVDKLTNKTAITAKLNTAQWAKVPLELRDRAFFSANVESVRFLTIAQKKLLNRLKLQTEQLENGKNAFINRDSFIRDMRRIAQEEGIQTTGQAGRGTIRDIRSVKRLGLIYDMQTESAAGYARWKTDLDADVLDEFPAYRLSPSTAAQPRPETYWRERWQKAGSATGWKGALRHQFIALKTSPIWAALSRFGTPWPPYDYGSTRILQDIDRATATTLGLIPKKGPVPVFKEGSGITEFNQTLEASVADINAEMVELLEISFGDQVTIKDSRASWRSPGSRYQTFNDLALSSAEEWSLAPTPKTINSKDAEKLMSKGYVVKAGNRSVAFTQETLDHWSGYKDAAIRPTFLPLAVKTVQSPNEVWRQENQDVYLKGFEKPSGKYRGCLVAVEHNGIVRTFFVKDLKGLNRARKGIELISN